MYNLKHLVVCVIGGGLWLASVSSAECRSLHQAIVAAWSADPNRQSLSVDVSAAQKEASAARAWFPGGAIVSGQYLDDHFIGSKVGYTTYQGGISVPLWLPGQGRATEQTALNDENVAHYKLKVQKLVVAVKVIDVAARANFVKDHVKNLEKTQRTLSAALVATEKAHSVGEISGADYDALQAENEDIAGLLSEARQQLDVMQADIQALTGDDDIPDLNQPDALLSFDAARKLDVVSDPRVQLADASVKRAQSSYTLAQRSYIPAPQIGFMVSRQEQYQSPWDTQVGVQFQVALPSEARNVPITMKAVQAVSAAERDLALAKREITAEYRRLQAQMSSAKEILQHADAKHKFVKSREQDMARAMKVGEVSMIEYLRVQRQLLQASDRLAQANATIKTNTARMALMTGQML